MPNAYSPWPTEPEVARMTPQKRGAVRHRYRRRGLPIPSYLAPTQPGGRPSKAAASEMDKIALAEVAWRAQAEQEALRRRGFPKRLPCLACGRLRLAGRPDQRMHANCRRPELDFQEHAA